MRNALTLTCVPIEVLHRGVYLSSLKVSLWWSLSIVPFFTVKVCIEFAQEVKGIQGGIAIKTLVSKHNMPENFWRRAVFDDILSVEVLKQLLHAGSLFFPFTVPDSNSIVPSLHEWFQVHPRSVLRIVVQDRGQSHLFLRRLLSCPPLLFSDTMMYVPSLAAICR